MVLPKRVENDRMEVLTLMAVKVDPINVDALLILLLDRVEMTLY
jgi:hypothetical protein